MKPCFGYIRVSTQKQGEGVSLEAQKDAITGFASRTDLRITQWFEEKETAAKGGRPVFNQMLRQLKRGDAQGLVVHKIDRSARNLRDWAIVSELPDQGIDVHIATESLDFTSRGGRLTADIQAVIAADFIRNLRDETIKGIDGRLRQGLYPHPAPPGYQNTGRGNPKSINPTTGPLIKTLFSLYLSGDHSIRSLHKEMRDRGLTSSTGRLISKQSVERILSNTFYCGLIEIPRTGEIITGLHEPLISVREFQQVQALKAGRHVKKTTKHTHVFRGLVHCAACRSILTPERQKGRVYYRCHTSKCPSGSAREDVINAAIRDALSRIELNAKDQGEITDGVNVWQIERDVASDLRAVDLRLADANARLERLTDYLVDGTLSESDFKTRRGKIDMDISRLKEEQARARATQDNDKRRYEMAQLATRRPQGCGTMVNLPLSSTKLTPNDPANECPID